MTRDFRGVRRRTIPSSFLMEMPREEMELVDEATAHIAHHEQEKHDIWDEPESMEDWIGGEVGSTNRRRPNGNWTRTSRSRARLTPNRHSPSPRHRSRRPPPWHATRSSESAPPLPRVSPDVFQQGMTVIHPEYGPGKIVALSGAGKNRRATIQFATVGQKKIILAHSLLRPVR